MGAFGDPQSVVAVVMWQMASGPGKCQLCAVPDSYANPFRVSALSMGDPGVLSGVPGALCRVESVELPLLRDAGPPLVAGPVPNALDTKYTKDAFHAIARANLHSPRREAVRGCVTRSNLSKLKFLDWPICG